MPGAIEAVGSATGTMPLSRLGGLISAAWLLLLLRPNENDAAVASDEMDPRLRIGLIDSGLAISSVGWAASGSGMTISMTRSRRGAFDGARLPLSDPTTLATRDLGCPSEVRLVEDGEKGKADDDEASSSKGSSE